MALIAAYRDNEVSSNHPTGKMITECKNDIPNVLHIELGPLNLDTLNTLINTAFPTVNTLTLAEVVLKKTEGTFLLLLFFYYVFVFLVIFSLSPLSLIYPNLFVQAIPFLYCSSLKPYTTRECCASTRSLKRGTGISRTFKTFVLLVMW